MNEQRLIDASTLRKEVNECYDHLFRAGIVPHELIIYAESVDALIDNAPTIEPRQDAEHDATQYSNGYQDGFLEARKLFTDPENAAVLEKVMAEIISILKDVMPQVVEIAKEYATGNGMKEGQPHE